MTNPRITLAGQEYEVKPLAVRQLRIVVPALLRLQKARFDAISEAQFDDLMEVVFQGVSSAVTREAFDELPVKAVELIGAIPVVASQSGMMTGGEPGERAAGNPTGT